MKTSVTKMFGIDIPLFAFSHCRDVVVEVTNAGGFGVLGGSTFTPESLEQELAWIDERVKGRPYGVDIVVPGKLIGKGEALSADDFSAMIPDEDKDFVAHLLSSYDIPTSSDDVARVAPPMVDEEAGRRLLEVAFRHPIKMIANALGVPPKFMIDAAKTHGVPVGALVGAKEHALKQIAAGVDFLVVQGAEAGGHCGEVSTMVLVPEVIEAIGDQVPVLAAGGIVTGRQMAAAIALGAAGAWTGSVWLTTPESEVPEFTRQKMLAASSRDTRRSAYRTGKPSRQLKSAWTEAYAQEGAPKPLGMPLQSMLSRPALSEVDRLAATGHQGAQELATYFVGQGVGLMHTQRTSRQTVLDFAEDYLAAVERINESLDD